MGEAAGASLDVINQTLFSPKLHGWRGPGSWCCLPVPISFDKHCLSRYVLTWCIASCHMGTANKSDCDQSNKIR
eukprot:624580-Amphidinium_carterae.1